MKKDILALLVIVPASLHAQEISTQPKYGISLSGFVKTDAFYDTRQTVSIREGHFLLYPENISPDANGLDINAGTNFNILSIQSRLKGTITAPDAFGAKTSGVIEADFFGNENANFSDVNGFRIRHAFVKLNWGSTELMAGQYWHPMFIAESFPGVISFNTGAPFQPFTRNPQIRLTQSFSGLKLMAAVFSQRDFTSTGPDGASSKYIRNSGIPNAHLQVQYYADSINTLVGAGIDYKTITPELFTTDYFTGENKFRSEKSLSSFSATGFLNIKLKPVTFKLEGIYAQNAFDMVMIGGYAVKEVTDSTTGAKEFANLNTASVWTEIHTNGSRVQLALFGGYTKNLGSEETIAGPFYARGSNIDHIFRLSPRIVFISGKLSVALEGEYTSAAYGTANGDGKGGVTGATAVANTRGMLAFIYNF